MRYFCVAMLLASAIGSADVVVTAARQRPASGQPRADIPEEFRFLLHSPEQRIREAAERATYWEDLWKGLPYDSISLERGGTGGCLIVCGSTKVTLYRGTTAGIFTTLGGLRGRAELRTVAADMTLQVARRTELAGSVDLYTYANLSYLLHNLRFLELPDVYYSEQAKQDHPFATLTVVANGKTKAVTDYGEGRPVELWVMQQALDSVSKSIRWAEK